MSKLSLILPWFAFHGYSCEMIATNEVIKYTNDVVTEGNTGQLSCKASSRIGICTWTRMKDDMKFSSEVEYGSPVSTENSVEIQDDECWLFIPNIDVSNAGNWTCTVDECAEDGMKIAKACSNQDLQMKVVEQGGFGAIAAQHVYNVKAEDPALVVVKTNEKFDKCEIKKDGYDYTKVVVDGDATKYECLDLQYVGKICAGEANGCMLKINGHEVLQKGNWTFTIQKGNNWPEIVVVELV